VAGKELFDGETSMEVMYKHLNEKPPSLSPDTSASLNSVEINKVLLRALQKNPQERYQSIQDFSEDFLKAIGTKALWSQRLFKRLKRNIGLTALLAIICSISCVSLLSMMRKSHPLALPTVVKNNTDSGSINDRPVILLRDAFVTYRNAREGKNASSIKVRASLFAPSLRKIDQAVHELEIHPDAYLSFAAAFTNSRILGAARHELDHWDEKDRTKRQAALARDNESVLKYGLSKIKPNWKLEKALLECELGALYSEMHEIDNAREVFENVLLDWKTEPPSPCAEAQKYAGSFIGSVIGEPNYFKLGSLNSLAHIYEAEGSIKKAEATYKKTLEYVKAQHLSPAEPDVFRGLANYALFLHKHAQLAKSRSILAGLSQTLHDCNDDQWLLKGHQVLAEIYEQMNMKDNAEKEVNLAKRYVNAAGEPRDAFEAAHHRYQDTLK